MKVKKYGEYNEPYHNSGWDSGRKRKRGAKAIF